MDDQLETPGEEDPKDFLEELLEGFLGPRAAEEAARAMRDQGLNLSSLGQFSSPHAMSQAMNQFRFLMNSSDDPVNWRMVEDISRQAAYQSGDPRLTAAQAGAVRQVLSVADLWLDPVTDFTLRGVEREAWTRVEWIDQTLPAWKEIFNPVAKNVARAMSEAMSDQFESPESMPEEMSGLMGSIGTLIPKMSAMSFGAQVGQGLSAMAKEIFGTSDTGFPLTETGVTALVPTNIASFAEGLDEDFAAVEQYIAVREVAHARLMASVPWLRHDLSLAIMRYAEEIAIDADAIAEAARSIDPADPESLNRAMAGGVFAAEPTEAQIRAQERIETLLSLIEGWVEVTTTAAVTPYLPSADRLREMIRRRRVTGSSAERLLTQLVGLELRPRRARGAARIFRDLESAEGPGARDGVWAHPDSVPTVRDLDDPESYRPSTHATQETTELDLEMQQLLAGTLGWDAGVPQDQRSISTEEEPNEGDEPLDETR